MDVSARSHIGLVVLTGICQGTCSEVKWYHKLAKLNLQCKEWIDVYGCICIHQSWICICIIICMCICISVYIQTPESIGKSFPRPESHSTFPSESLPPLHITLALRRLIHGLKLYMDRTHHRLDWLDVIRGMDWWWIYYSSLRPFNTVPHKL